MVTYRLVPEDDWERTVSALEAAAAALRRSGRMTLPDMPAEAPRAVGASGRTSAAPRRRKAMKRARGDGAALARQVVERVDAGGTRHTPTKFNSTGPTIADFVFVLGNGGPFRVGDLAEPLRRYVALKDMRRKAAGQIRTAVERDNRFQRLGVGRYQVSATGNEAQARTLIEEMTEDTK